MVGLGSVPGTSAPRVMEDGVRRKLVLILVPSMEPISGEEKPIPGTGGQRYAGSLSKSNRCSSC